MPRLSDSIGRPFPLVGQHIGLDHAPGDHHHCPHQYQYLQGFFCHRLHDSADTVITIVRARIHPRPRHTLTAGISVEFDKNLTKEDEAGCRWRPLDGALQVVRTKASQTTPPQQIYGTAAGGERIERSHALARPHRSSPAHRSPEGIDPGKAHSVIMKRTGNRKPTSRTSKFGASAQDIDRSKLQSRSFRISTFS